MVDEEDIFLTAQQPSTAMLQPFIYNDRSSHIGTFELNPVTSLLEKPYQEVKDPIKL